MSSFNEILQRMLGRVPDTRDKRPGSVIYDTLSPVAAVLAQTDINAAIFEEQSYLLTATGKSLDDRAADWGMSRRAASFAVRIGETKDTEENPIDLPIGSRFSLPNTSGGLNFTLTENLPYPGYCLLTCETAGTSGNAYLGILLPLFTINNLGSAEMIGTQIPAEDTETDNGLRARVLARINQKAFGGNVADYEEFTKEIAGIGDVKVFPVWDGGGTVKLSIIDSEYNPATPEFVKLVQSEIDPIPNGGEGYGLAPIGHRVMVATPEAVMIDISATVTLQSGFTIGQLQADIEAAISAYLLELRRTWAGLLSL